MDEKSTLPVWVRQSQARRIIDSSSFARPNASELLVSRSDERASSSSRRRLGIRGGGSRLPRSHGYRSRDPSVALHGWSPQQGGRGGRRRTRGGKQRLRVGARRQGRKLPAGYRLRRRTGRRGRTALGKGEGAARLRAGGRRGRTSRSRPGAPDLPVRCAEGSAASLAAGSYVGDDDQPHAQKEASHRGRWQDSGEAECASLRANISDDATYRHQHEEEKVEGAGRHAQGSEEPPEAAVTPSAARTRGTAGLGRVPVRPEVGDDPDMRAPPIGGLREGAASGWAGTRRWVGGEGVLGRGRKKEKGEGKERRWAGLKAR
ncbi:hypothetical protein PVAP13_3NG254688 [Panicum virgatum]|uniref:Uncharacterized protein n=1 Tax=Panicum virgatum TaxID=38727 RepID=A0A8T0UKF2_PANVG|nr:hypothetical protein PVAP13_3NG254688 [Panicum virgatum]